MKPSQPEVIERVESRGPASDTDVKALHRLLGVNAPEDLLAFWKTSDGGVIYLKNSDAKVWLSPIQQIAEENRAYEVNTRARGAVVIGCDGTTEGCYFFLKRRSPRYFWADVIDLENKSGWVDLGDTFARFLRNVGEMERAEREQRDPVLDLGGPGKLRRAPEQKLNESALECELARIKLPKDVFAVIALSFSEDGKRCLWASGSHFSVDIDTGEISVTTRCGLGDVHDRVDGTGILSSFEYNRVYLWDGVAGRLVKEFKEGDNTHVLSVSVDRAISRCLTATRTGFPNEPHEVSIRLWDLNTGSVRKDLDLSEIIAKHGDPYSARWTFTRVGVSPLGDMGAVVLTNTEMPASGSVLLLDLRKLQILAENEFASSCGYAHNIGVAFSKESRFCLAREWLNTAVWDTKRQTRVLHCRSQEEREIIEAVAFVPGRPWVAVGTRANGIRIIDLTTGDTVQRYEGKATNTLSLAISLDGKRMATWGQSGGGNPIRIWRLPEG